jgi:4-diphosphocytidyl-2-C-methyl-D-erythritol kinase
MWGLGIPLKELATLGAEIGSDVPALVLGGVVLMEGRGERVAPLFTRHPSLVTSHLVLANPGVFCSTPEIFKAFDAPLPNRPEILYNIRLAMQSGDGVAVAQALQNDLAATATRLHPEIGAARRRLETAGCLGASMSGSGATVFGIVRDAAEAGRIARTLEAEGLWSVAVETVR